MITTLEELNDAFECSGFPGFARVDGDTLVVLEDLKGADSTKAKTIVGSFSVNENAGGIGTAVQKAWCAFGSVDVDFYWFARTVARAGSRLRELIVPFAKGIECSTNNWLLNDELGLEKKDGEWFLIEGWTPSGSLSNPKRHQGLMTVREAFSKLYGTVPHAAACYVGYSIVGLGSFRGPVWVSAPLAYEVSSDEVTWSRIRCEHKWMGPDIADRPAHWYKGFFDDAYDALVGGGE